MAKRGTDNNEAEIEGIRELNACGLFCPEPVMMLHNEIRDMEAGELLRVIATDPSTTRDIPKFCLYLGHELVEESQQDEKYFYLVRKKPAESQPAGRTTTKIE